jgi:uncharacterized protein YndB with AHSA1/START domain
MPHLKEQTAMATLSALNGRASLRFERELPYPVERVWQAVSEPAELERWFPAAAAWTPAVGETFEAAGAVGEVTEVDAPNRLAWTYNDEDYSFDLAGHDGGCVLAFTHVIKDGALAAQTATGWHTYLSRLEPHLAGGFLSEDEAHEGWAELHERYAERFGVDPTPGRRFAASLRGSG